MVELLSAQPALDSPGLVGLEKSGQYHCMVDLQLSGEAEASPL